MNNYFHKTHLSAVIIFTFIVLLNCSGCPNGESGKLMPQKAENIKLVKTEKADDTAQIEKDGKIFQISGNWENPGKERLQIVVSNNTDAEFQIDLMKVKIETTSGESAVLDFVYDGTDLNLADNNPNNDEAKELYEDRSVESIKFIVPPKQMKRLVFGFNNYQIKENRLQPGSQVYVTVPTGEYPADSIKILFNCADNEFFAF